MLKKSLILIAGVVLLLSLVGCKSNTNSVSPFSKDEQESFMQSYMGLVTKPSEPEVLEEKMKGNIERLSKDEASNVVDGLLYAMYQKYTTINQKADGLQDTMKKYTDQGIDLGKAENLKSINDETLKAFLGEVQKNHYFIVKDNDKYVAQPDMAYMLQKYEQYMSDALKAMVLFSKEEYESGFFDEKTQKFDLDKITKRILMLEDNLNKYAGSYYEEPFKNSKAYYYQIYFGVNNDFLMDSKKVVLKDVLDHYEKTIAANPNSQLAKDLKAYMEQLKKSNNEVTANVLAYLADLTKVEESVTNQSSGSIGTDQQVKDAIKDALKENK